MDKDLLDSLKRTLVPIVVGMIAASVAGPYVDIQALDDLLAGLIAGAYYTVLRLIEMRVPQVGVLLGATRQPHYFQ